MQKFATQIRVAPSGRVIGFDLPAMLALAQVHGYCEQSFLALIGEAEAGMLLGLRELQHGDNA